MPILSANLLTDGALQAGLWKYAFFLGLFGVVVPVICFSIGVPKVGTGLGTILGATELPTAIIASITLVHEVVTFMQWIGIIFILVGIFTPQSLRLGKKGNKIACIALEKYRIYIKDITTIKISKFIRGINDYFKHRIFAIMCIFFLIRYMKEKKFYDLLLIPVCIYAGAVKTPFVEYLNFNTTFKITYDIALLFL